LTTFSLVPKNALMHKCWFDPFEEQFYLPAAFVQLGDGEDVEGEIVGEEHQPLAGLRIAELDAPKRTVEPLARIEAGQDDGLIAHETGGAIDWTGIAPPCFQVGTWRG
jgi:hypothetical protein